MRQIFTWVMIGVAFYLLFAHDWSGRFKQRKKKTARPEPSDHPETFARFWARWEQTHGGSENWMDCPACSGSGGTEDFQCETCAIKGIASRGSGRVKRS